MDMIELLPHILRGIVGTTMNLVLMLTLLQPKYSKKVTYLAMLGILSIDLGTAIFCYISGNLTLLAKFERILFAVLCFVIKPLFKDNFMQWLFSYITIQNISAMVVVIGFVVSEQLPYPLYANVPIRLLLFLLFYWLLKYQVRPLYRQMVEHWNVFFYLAFAVWVAYTYYFVTSDDVVVTLTEQAIPLLLVTAITLAAYISICHTLSIISKEHILREERLRSIAQQELLQTELVAQESFVNLAKQNRHDMRHHNALLVDYLERGDVNGAREYLLQHDALIVETTLMQYCENVVANAVIRRYARRSANGGISFSTEVNIPEHLPLTAPEIGELFGNLLENACEACEKVKDSAYIILTVHTDNESLRLELRNSVAVQTVFNEDGLPLTTKEGGGAGTRSTATIVQRYGGMLHFTQEGNVFFTRIILQLDGRVSR
jgi:hypothetical protein